MANILYGAQMREQFPILSGFYLTNHGSFGLSPKCVLDEKKRILDEIESNPDKYFRWDKDVLYKEMNDIAAKFMGANPNNLVITENATTAVNCVVKSLKLKSGEAILVNNLTYPAVMNACQAACARVEGAICYVLRFEFPIHSEDSFVEKYETFFKEHPKVKLAIVDHITSGTALKLPIERLIEACRRHDVLVMIDGAHAPGQLPINIEEIGADFYIGSLHKWSYVPRSCAVLWVDPCHQKWVSPLVTSHIHIEGLFEEFRYQGTMDYSSYMCIKAGLQFYHDVGGLDKITAYTSNLSSKAATMLAQAWGTDQLPVPESMRAPNMKCIRLPTLPYDHTLASRKVLMKEILDKYHVCAGVFPLKEKELYIRISAQIYNTMEDYETVKLAILDIVKNSKEQE